MEIGILVAGRDEFGHHQPRDGGEGDAEHAVLGRHEQVLSRGDPTFLDPGADGKFRYYSSGLRISKRVN
jgi:hypothetical protein